MTPATITPLPGGKALFSWRGIEHTFDSLYGAIGEARTRGIAHEVLPFPDLPVDLPSAVLAVSPAFKS